MLCAAIMVLLGFTLFATVDLIQQYRMFLCPDNRMADYVLISFIFNALRW